MNYRNSYYIHGNENNEFLTEIGAGLSKLILATYMVIK